MLPKCLQNKFFSNGYQLVLLLILFYALPAFSADETTRVVGIPTAQNMLERFATQIPNLMRMTTAIAYVLGMYFIFNGVLLLKKFGEQRTMMSSEQSLKGPIIYITIGALLLYLPTSVQVGMSTFWSIPNPYGYVEQTSQWGQFLRVCFLIIQFIGTIAFIRGLVILSHLGGHGQQGTFSKGLTHIIGGILCINIYQTVKVIASTLGLNFNV